MSSGHKSRRSKVTKTKMRRTTGRGRTRRQRTDPVLELSGDIDGLPADLSANLKGYLARTYAAGSRVP